MHDKPSIKTAGNRISSDQGIHDFEHPHILTLFERNAEGFFVMLCRCGETHAITGLGWLQWIEKHAPCGNGIFGSGKE